MGENFDWREGQTMPGIAINPGTGPVHNTNEVDAFFNVTRLCEDAGVLDQMIEKPQRRPDHEDGDGRYTYEVRLGDRVCEIAMPGLALGEVRFMGEPGQDIWDFPRLYVNGSSWVWRYAINSVRRALTGEEDDGGNHD